MINGKETTYENGLQKWDQKYTELILNKPARIVRGVSKATGRFVESCTRGYAIEQGITTAGSPFADLAKKVYAKTGLDERQNAEAFIGGLVGGIVQDLFTAIVGVSYLGGKLVGTVRPEIDTVAESIRANPWGNAVISVFYAKLTGQTAGLIYLAGKRRERAESKLEKTAPKQEITTGASQ